MLAVKLFTCSDTSLSLSIVSQCLAAAEPYQTSGRCTKAVKNVLSSGTADTLALLHSSTLLKILCFHFFFVSLKFSTVLGWFQRLFKT